LSHLILCPGTLIAQWVNELKTLFRPHAIEILIYDSRVMASEFWGESGQVQSSLHMPQQRIVIASHSVCATLFVKAMTNQFPRFYLMTSGNYTGGPNEGGMLGHGWYLKQRMKGTLTRAFLVSVSSQLSSMRLITCATLKIST